jgi:hypothetical protein
VILEFPENREINREFFGFLADLALSNANSRCHFNALQPNSLRSAKVGDFVGISMRCRPIPWSGRNREFFRGNREFIRRNREFVFPDRCHGNDRRERSSSVVARMLRTILSSPISGRAGWGLFRGNHCNRRARSREHRARRPRSTYHCRTSRVNNCIRGRACSMRVNILPCVWLANPALMYRSAKLYLNGMHIRWTRRAIIVLLIKCL